MSEKRFWSTTRREFVRAVTTSLVVPGLPIAGLAGKGSQSRGAAAGGQEREQPAAREPEARAETQIEYPRVFTGRSLARISFPLGGIGTGGIGLGGRGNLTAWEIFNRPSPANYSQFAVPALWVKVGRGAPKSRVLERRLLPPYDLHAEGLGSANVPGLPRLAEATFLGSFPLAKIEFHDNTLPVRISLEAFTSFQPVDADLSGLPCAVLSYEVTNADRESAEVVVAWSVENPIKTMEPTRDGAVEPEACQDQRSNEVRQSAGLQGIVMTDPSLADDHPLKGSFVLAVLEGGGWPGPGLPLGPQRSGEPPAFLVR